MLRSSIRAIALTCTLAGPTLAAASPQPAPVRMHDAAQRRAIAATFLAEHGHEATATQQLTVTTLADHVPGSLRDAIERANAQPGMAIVDFSPSLEGTIHLADDALFIHDSIVIVGPGADKLAIDAGGKHSILYAYGSDTLDLAILGLTLRGGSAASGAGMTVYNSHLLLSDTIVEDNNTINSLGDLSGGGLYFRDGSLRIDHCVFRDNSAGAAGGGASVRNATVWIRDSSFTGNLARSGGGLHVDTPFSVDVRRSLVASNNAARRGGGIELKATGAAAVIENVTVSGNFAQGEQPTDGGGGIALTGSARIALSTIAYNFAYAFQRDANVAAGVQYDSPQGLLFLNGNLLWGNATLSGGNVDLGRDGGGMIEAIHNLIGATTPGAVNRADQGTLLGVDPLLTPLADNGGPTHTHAIAADSPARDAATWIQYAVDTDQRGFQRRRHDDEVMDLGAYEHGADCLFADGFDG
ncbi:right-handed parallel beta-helix repeat-containing protein [Dokdonella sp.]|uniref:right-handed parallel beta-helix repeat-containing protein n=1 Tax=Dokdonella sp. TaxID=2291710 RepID=UPI001B203321|nr:right-handed parallel beta-helix repeat-containing protein [Dokdonella sp.]MBO9663553.1 right-handed parallel beta-helix repeat-containing protein [Dokdonella sp.]